MSSAASPFVARAATPSDYERYRYFVAQLELPADEPTIRREQWETEWMPSTFFVVHGREVIGYGVARATGETGHVVHVVTDRARRGRGVGGAVLREAAARLRTTGCSAWALHVRVGNAPALGLYERFGMRVAHRSTSLSMAWEDVARLPGDPLAAAGHTVAPDADDDLEHAFRLAAGRLAALRARGLVLLALRGADGAALGVACFDPVFPGAMLFRVARPGLARALLDAMRTHARADDTSVALLCEADDALVDTLRAAGAQVRAEMLHMTGPLPPA